MYELDKNRFGSFVAQLRKEKGYTQKELAEQLFLSAKAISKWETGVTTPDTSLLIPLAELLGVSVTELLMGEHIQSEKSLDHQQVESILKSALSLSGTGSARAWKSSGVWSAVYIISLLLGSVGIFLCSRLGLVTETASTAFLLGGVFGAYFCFFVKTKLPPIYDQTKIGLYYDKVFRMNIPGVAFTNSNWPRIITAGRIWACCATCTYPLLTAWMGTQLPDLWLQIDLYVFLVLILGGLFIPIYIIAKKYE